MTACRGIGAFGLALILTMPLAGGADTPLNARVRYLKEQVETSPRPSPEKLARNLLARFPPSRKSSNQAAEDWSLLLSAAVRVDDPEPDRGQPFNVPLFNALLGRVPGEAARDQQGKTALMYAAGADDLETLRALLPYSVAEGFRPRYTPDRNGKPYIDWCDADGYTALMHACDSRSILAVNYLLNAGASITPTCHIAHFDAMQLAQISRDPQVIAALERKRAELAERAKERQELEASMRWLQNRQYWREMLFDRQVTAGILLALLAWLCYLGVWWVRRLIRRYRVGQEVWLIAEQERGKFRSEAEWKAHVREVKKAILRDKRFRTRKHIHHNLVWSEDQDYVARLYPETSDKVRTQRIANAAKKASTHG